VDLAAVASSRKTSIRSLMAFAAGASVSEAAAISMSRKSQRMAPNFLENSQAIGGFQHVEKHVLTIKSRYFNGISVALIPSSPRNYQVYPAWPSRSTPAENFGESQGFDGKNMWEFVMGNTYI
jgi:hypothetical protein